MAIPAAIPPTERIKHADGSVVELTDIPIHPGTLAVRSDKPLRLAQMEGRGPVELGTLLSLCRDLLVKSWDRVRFGPCIEGAVFELQLSSQPQEFSVLDGYLTVVIPPGPAHFHLCIG